MGRAVRGEGEGPGGDGRTRGWRGLGSLWNRLLPSGFLFQAAVGKMGKVLGQYGDPPMPMILLPQGEEKVCMLFSQL